MKAFLLVRTARPRTPSAGTRVSCLLHPPTIALSLRRSAIVLAALACLWLFSLLPAAVAAQQPQTLPPSPKATTAAKAAFVKHRLSYKIIAGEQHTFGYDILNHGRPLIHQPTVPALAGNKGFATKEDARKVARLVIQKINKNGMPPSVTPEEMAALNIKF